jgi:hypothetical protein
LKLALLVDENADCRREIGRAALAAPSRLQAHRAINNQAERVMRRQKAFAAARPGNAPCKDRASRLSDLGAQEAYREAAVTLAAQGLVGGDCPL